LRFLHSISSLSIRHIKISLTCPLPNPIVETISVEVENLSDEEIIEKLTAVKGIGRWSAQMVLIFSMNRPNVLPLGDTGFKRVVKISYNLGPSPSEEEIKKIAEAWRPYRSIASWYMWQTVNK